MSTKSYLYRHFDKNGQLLYVGRSITPLSRHDTHRSASYWFDDIECIKIEKLSIYTDAVVAEYQAIKREKPRHNVNRTDAYKDTLLLTQRDRTAKRKAIEGVFLRRRENIAALAEVAGTWHEFARWTAYSPQFLVNIAGPNPTRAIGEKLARNLELALNLPVGWLDAKH
jgi:hypothetical protein